MKTVKTYRQFVKQAGLKDEIGSKALMGDRLIREYKGKESELVAIFAPGIADALARGFIQLGQIPTTNVEIWTERDVFLRAREYGAILETIQGKLPIQYLLVAYKAWQDAQNEVTEWENKGLKEYLTHWLYKKKRGKRITAKIYELLDYIEPEEGE